MTISLLDLPDRGDPNWDVPLNAKLTELIKFANARPLDVRDFGAVGNGVVDDTAAIQAAIDAAPFGGIVSAAQGTFKLTSKVTVKAGVSLQGSNVYSTTFLTNQATGDVFELQSAATVERCSVRSSVTRTSGAHVFMSGSQCLVSFVNFGEYFEGIRIGVAGGAKAGLPRVRNCVFTGTSVLANSGGIFLCNFADAKIEEVTMTGPGAGTVPAYGIRVTEGDTWFMDTVNIVRHGRALWVNPPSGKSVFAGYIVNGMFDSPGAVAGPLNVPAALIEPAASAFVYDTQFVNCWFGNSADSGLLVQGSGVTDGLQVVGSLGVSNGWAGFRFIGATVKNWAIHGGLASGNTQYGIDVQSGSTDFIIEGVRAGNTGVHGTNGIGINLGAAAQDRYAIVDNLLTGNSAAAISENTTGSPTRIVEDNLGADQDWTAWTSTVVGITTPTRVTRYRKIGKLCTVFVDITGTSSTTGFTFTLPFAANNALSMFSASITNNGVVSTTPGKVQTAAGSNVATVLRDAAATAWTATGTKALTGFEFTYEID